MEGSVKLLCAQNCLCSHAVTYTCCTCKGLLMTVLPPLRVTCSHSLTRPEADCHSPAAPALEPQTNRCPRSALLLGGSHCRVLLGAAQLLRAVLPLLDLLPRLVCRRLHEPVLHTSSAPHMLLSTILSFPLLSGPQARQHKRAAVTGAVERSPACMQVFRSQRRVPP